ncbi:integrator complex assembly factor BRAT1 isoform X2 [Echeneis naucrates]|uniref:integrator complex assembly factor BRAT1 isoform X2 n=1 Tax=Echeneis naucrates TaxID=173247 RepID=UPI001113DAEC|nr:BRCA1-associated ATM activator 1 isoform X2 [Echeneis naucrates]
MDADCVLLLPGVCQVLLDSGRSLPDDTTLEKLLDWLTGITEADKEGSLLEVHPCLLEFISFVVCKTSSDPSVISFTLKLCGLMGATEDGFKRLQESSVLDLAFSRQHWHEAGLWEDPCIRIGWIQGLRSMLLHSKALSFFVQADLTAQLLQLQTDTSLFVASAANQMLAHILLFFQPVMSAGCNTIGKKHWEDKRTQASIIGPGVTMDTSEDYDAVLAVTSKYLQESLVPKENTQFHQSLQTLKLLGLLLAQARPPLRDQLLQTAADPLEEVVTAGCSQLTLPLMDVVLAAYSSSTGEGVPDQHVARLLSSMLTMSKPADLIQAAAALLSRGHPDSVHAAQAVRILLLPLDLITGQALLGTNTAADKHRFSMVDQLKSKTSCISMICVCLTNTPQISLMPADLLPCPSASIVTAVLSLLRICSGDSSSSPAGCPEVFRNVISSGKVQKSALEALTGLSSSPGVKGMLIEVLAVLIEYLNHPDSDPIVLHKSYQAVVQWLSVCVDLSFTTDKLQQDLVEVVKKRVCDMRWEVRDSTVEFLGKLAGVLVSAKVAPDTSEVLLGGCCSASLLREALQDPESYVRASAISALAQTLAHSWQQGAAPTQQQTDIVSRLLEILSQDTEGFARRAVVQYFIAWFSSRSSSTSRSPSTSTCSTSPLLMNSVSTVLSLGSADLDWEVKVHTLELAELLLDEAFLGHRGYRKGSDTHLALPHPYAVVSDQTCTLHTHNRKRTEGMDSDLAIRLKTLVEQGVFSVLLSGLVDCDRPVSLKACQLLIKFRETVCPVSIEAPEETVAEVSCELPGWGWGQDISKTLGMTMSDQAKVADIAANGAHVFDSEDCKENVNKGGDSVCVRVCEVLRSLGLDAKLDILIQSSDHVHNSPLSLLQDILTAGAAHSHPDTQPGQEVIVDCY